MKKFMVVFLLMLVASFLLVLPGAFAEAVNAVPVVDPAEQAGYSWGQLGTIVGAIAATLLIVQYIKLPIDKVWRIPTRAIVYVIAFSIMLLAQAFTSGLVLSAVPLLLFNAFIVATSAMGAYEITFSSKDKQKYINSP